MIRIDHEAAADLLEQSFTELEKSNVAKIDSRVHPALASLLDTIFHSPTAAIREALLGCVLIRSIEPSVNVRLPYQSQGENAFSGRSLDERVVNPFLHSRHIPASKGPYLSVFRRSVEFGPDTRKGVKDKLAYDAFDAVLSFVEKASEQEVCDLLTELLQRFLSLREASKVVLLRVGRLSLLQYESLIDTLSKVPSGGRLPVFLVVSAFCTIVEHFALPWEVSHQEINVADTASGAGGDVTIKHGNEIVLRLR